jgi:SAM-dependent methyltransferase
MNRKSHWEAVYGAKSPEQLTWHQATPHLSLEMIAASTLPLNAAVIDVGGGASTLVDHLLYEGYSDLTVLDIAANALAAAQARLGARAEDVTWLEADVLHTALQQRYDLWHDRAVFHFLVDPADQERYVATVRSALKIGGYLILATFAPDGPARCSNLEVVRYSAEALGARVGSGFHLVRSEHQTHTTPWGSHQEFLFCHFHRHG